MTIPIEVPNLGESITQAVILKWYRNDGDQVRMDEPLCELETDKANTDLAAKAAGVLKRLKKEGDTVAVGEKVGSIEEGAAGATGNKPVVAPPAAAAPADSPKTSPGSDLGPAARRVVAENQLDAASIKGSGPGGRITKEDAESAAKAKSAPVRTPPPAMPSAPSAPAPAAKPPAPAPEKEKIEFGADGIARQPMSKLRKRIAERLVQAQHTAAILTTFNEVDLTEVINLRAKFKEQFEKIHGVGLGFMSFFARATIAALRELPRVNAFLEGDDIVYHRYVNLGIAVSTDRGLAVPVLRNAQDMSFAKIESEIKRLATATRDGKLNLEELSGGTFSITNGGVFGSLLSTPILNPPQSGILGMHSIQKRPVVINDKVEVRSMMYLALSYDHRIVDGKEAITFLVRIKQMLEDPARLLLDL